MSKLDESFDLAMNALDDVEDTGIYADWPKFIKSAKEKRLFGELLSRWVRLLNQSPPVDPTEAWGYLAMSYPTTFMGGVYDVDGVFRLLFTRGASYQPDAVRLIREAQKKRSFVRVSLRSPGGRKSFGIKPSSP